MPTTQDVDNIKLKTYDLFFEGQDLGLTIQGTVSLNLGEGSIPVNNVDQFFGVVKSFSQGFSPTLTTTLAKSDFETIFSILAKTRATPVIGAGGKIAYYIGNKKVEKTDIAGRLLLKPTGSGADRSEEIVLLKTLPDMTDTALVGDRDNIQTVALTWEIYPDLDAPVGKEVGIFGNSEAVQVDPEGVWISSGARAAVPGVHSSAIDMNPAEHKQMQAFALFAEDSSLTAAIDDVGDITAADTSIVFDTGSGDNIFIVGQYIKIDNEIMYLTNVVYATATTGTLTVDRGIGGTAAAAHLDDAVITIQENVGVLNITDSATWATSDDTKADVGNTFQGTFSPVTGVGTKKGAISHVAAGSANITATFGATASPNLAVTVN